MGIFGKICKQRYGLGSPFLTGRSYMDSRPNRDTILGDDIILDPKGEKNGAVQEFVPLGCSRVQ